MSSVIITNGELYEIVKKGKLSTIQETDEEDGKKIEEYADNLIIENETEKFLQLLEKKFCEETDATEFDSEDGVVNDLIKKIVLKIKEKRNSEKVTSRAGSNLLRLLLVFVEQFLRKDKKRCREQEQSCGGEKQTLTLTITRFLQNNSLTLTITRFCRTIP